MMVAELMTCRMPEDPASPVPVGGICRGMSGVLRAVIWCAIKPISPLFPIVLCLGIASLDPLGDLAHGGFCYTA
jgi:hypothetical protein